MSHYGGGFFSETINAIRNTTKERRPITLANGHRTTEYQVWRIAFGEKEPGVSRYIVNTNPITLEELADDRAGLVLYKKLKEVAPERLYPANHYYLVYRLPSSPFSIRVEIDNPTEVKRCYHELSTLSHKKLMHLAESSLDGLKLVPRQPGNALFNFDPEELVTVPGGELKTPASLAAFLSDLFLAGRISAEQFDKVMHQTTTDMRKETFTLIPPREQPKHEYLLKPAKIKKTLEHEDKYHLGLITLKEYAALKRPDLAKNDARLAVEWPRPERTYICIICGQDVATIKCVECDNRCCRSCVRRNFSEHLNLQAGEFVSSDIGHSDGGDSACLPLPPPKKGTQSKASGENDAKSWTKALLNGKSGSDSVNTTARSGTSEKSTDIWSSIEASDSNKNNPNNIMIKKKKKSSREVESSDMQSNNDVKNRSIVLKKKSSGVVDHSGEFVQSENDAKNRKILLKKKSVGKLGRHESNSTMYSDDSISGGGGGGEMPEAAFSPQTFLLIHHIYCLRNGRPTKDFLNGLHHYENRKKSIAVKHKKRNKR